MTEREGAPLVFVGFWRPPPPPPQCPPPSPPQTPQYLTILMTERGRHYVCRILEPPMPPPQPPTTPQYLTTCILMTEGGGAIIFCRILAPPNAPPPSPDATILNNLNDREGAPLCCRILEPRIMPPPPTTPQYLTTCILVTERGGAIIFL